MAKEARIVSAPLAAGAYGALNSVRSALIHAVEVNDADQPISVLCRKVRVASILDDAAEYNRYPVTCPTCRRRLPPR
jgi:hypothetical protein